MKKFYVFLDIDGVLYDWNYIKSLGPEHWGGVVMDFDPQSIEALNYLIAELRKVYDVELVISSTWRSNMNRTIQTLESHGLRTENLSIYRTKIFNNPRYRGREILDYLKDKRDKNNYVIIDDETFDFEEYFPSNRIIKPSIWNDLKKEMVDEFFKNNNLIDNKKR